MADSTILTPGCNSEEVTTVTVDESIEYLQHDNFLSEFDTEEEKAVARENLEVYPKTAVYTKDETDANISKAASTVINEHLTVDDPHGTLSAAKELMDGMVKDDGSTPFTAPQVGVDPVADNQLTTKQFVARLLEQHTKLTGSDDPHEILPEVLSLLEKYVKSSEIYSKSQLYTQSEIDSLLKSFVKKDGTTPFTVAQVGADPTIDSHLATKRYVDKTLYAHLVDVDPHGFLSILNQRLASYAKIANVYDKTQTYSRTQIDGLINKWVNDALDSAITAYQETVDDKIANIYAEKYVKSDGSVAFKNPQSGVDAIEVDQLVTLRQLNNQSENLSNQIEAKECTWKTSGPVEATVGHVEDNTQLQSELTLQEVCDAIFYGKSVELTIPEYVITGNKGEITVCIHGSTGEIQMVQLFQDDEVIYTWEGDSVRETFADGCTTVDSNVITADTDIKVVVTYSSGVTHEDTQTIKCSLPIFVGLLPKWKTASTITMDYLEELQTEDTEGTQNRFIEQGPELTSISFTYKFEDSTLRHPFVVIPKSYASLTSLVTKSQEFGLEAFDVVNDIPLSVNGQDVIYKIYVYKQALASMNQEVTFNFESE